jgi:putative spermidine/putrescine transport system ATP-binding protein
MAFLDLTNLEKIFGVNRVVKDFTLGIDKGEFVSLLGPSGCGKTTVLRMVAGFETPTSGSIRIDGQEVTGQRPNQRAIGMMFQAYALFPNMTVADNVAFGLKVKGVPRPERSARVAEMLELIGLPDLAARFPFQLSGGQQQRVALARALAPRPRVLLLDEPLSALDAKVRVSLRNEIREIQRELGITTIFVTHDQEEAMSISDRIVVMNGGIAEQAGAPFEIYNNPQTPFVARFVGTLNSFSATVEDPETGTLTVAGQRVTLGAGIVNARKGDKIALALRPEAIHLGRAEGREVVLAANIDEVHFLGSVIRIRVRVADTVVALDTFNRPDQPPPPIGSATEISFAARDVIFLPEDAPRPAR